MPLHIKLSTTLRDYVSGYNPLEGLDIDASGLASPRDVALMLGLPLDEIKITMLNGQHAALDSAIKDGDRVAFFPAVGGG